MKKFFAAMLFLLPWAVLGQSVDASQMKLKTDGSAAADTNNALKITVYRSGTAPAAPLTAGDLWCDTATTPCTLKVYNGSTWQAGVSVSTITTQTDNSTFPGSPSDGQLFYDKIHKVMWIYNSTTSLWYNTVSGASTSSSISDTFTGTVITAPASAPTIASSATAGTATGGNTTCKVTYSTSTGGETTPSVASNTLNLTASKKIDFTSVPTGGSGTTQRRFYCTQGAAPGGPWYWIGTISNNVDTTVTIDWAVVNGTGITRRIDAPSTNYSAPLNARWVAYLNASVTSGGCGSTGASIICADTGSATNTLFLGSTVTVNTAQNGVKVDLTAYTGNWTITYRCIRLVNQWSGGFGGGGGTIATMMAGDGTNYASGPDSFWVSTNSTNAALTNLDSSHRMLWAYNQRTGIIGSAAGTFTAGTGIWPAVIINPASANPLYVKIEKIGTGFQFFLSIDNRNWTPFSTTTGTTSITYADSTVASVPSNAYDYFFFLCGGAAVNLASVVEFDSFTLTVN